MRNIVSYLVSKICKSDLVVLNYQRQKIVAQTSNFQIKHLVFNNNKYEESIFRFFQKLDIPNGTILDVGANIGIYSLMFSRVCGANGKVFSFEPGSLNYTLLGLNKLINKLHNVYAFNYAVGNHDGFGKLFLDDPTTHSMKKVFSKSEQVNVVKIDTFCGKNNINKVDLIKIDVEGAEHDVLVGAEYTIKKHKPIIIIEFVENQQRIIDFLIKHNYELSVVTASGSLANIPLDLQGKYIKNIVAVPKSA